MGGKNTQSMQQQFDPEIKQRLLQVYDTGAKLAETPYQPYMAATVAPGSPAQMQGMQAAANAARAGIGQNELGEAIRVTRDVANFAPTNVNASAVDTGIGFNQISNQQVAAPQAITASQLGMDRIGPLATLSPERVSAQGVTAQNVTAGNVGQTDLSPYQNQYDTQVIDAALGDLDRARQMTQNRNAASAVAANAFGGDRQALVEAETNRSFAQQAANTAANLRQAGFENAQQMAQADIGRSLQADLANQQAGLTAGTATSDQALRAGLANQQAGLTAGSQNLQSQLDVARANQAARQAMEATQGSQSLQAQQSTAANQLQAAQLNAANNLAAQRANLDATLASGQARNQGLLSNQDAMLRAALANQQAGITAGDQRLRSAQQLAGFGDQMRGLAFQDAAALESVGTRQRDMAQELLDDRYRRFLEERDQPLRMFDVLRGGAGILPSPITQKSSGGGFTILGG